MPDFVADYAFAALDQVGVSSGRAEDSSVARLASGGFVLFTGNALQRFDADGQATGARTVLAGSVSGVSVAGMPGGGYVATWVNSQVRVAVQLFDANGTAVTGVLSAGTGTNYQQQPSVTALANGGFVIAWTLNGSASTIRAQVFHGDGTAASAEIVTTSSPYHNTFNPQVAALSDGGFVVSWAGNFDDTGSATVRAQSYSAAGVARGALVRVANSVSYYDNGGQSIAALPNGGYVLTWTETRSGEASRVMGQIYSADGIAEGARFQISSGTLNASQSTVAMFDNGTFLVTWKIDVPGAGPNYFQTGDVVGRLFDAGGRSIGAEFVVNQVTANGQDLPIVAAFGSGDAVILWRSFDGSGTGTLQSRLLHSVTNGTEGADTLTASSGTDFLRGLGGDDLLQGGAGSDTISGDLGEDMLEGGLGSDLLAGGAGSDTFRGSAGELSGDTIADFQAGDRIVISDATLAGFTFSLSGTLLSFTGGSLILSNAPRGALLASAAAGGGVQISFAPGISLARDIRSDFNGDGRSDIAWLHGSGAFTTWLGQTDGGLANNPGSGANALGADWRIVGQGDFNGDGIDDLLWRHSSGEMGQWQGRASGVFANNSGVAANPVDNSWSVAGVADYNGDGRDDVLWRHSSGAITQWLARADGSFLNNSGAAANNVGLDWSIVASGDFNGDGRGDVLWQHGSGTFVAWHGTASGALVNVGAVLGGAVGSVVASGDFDGDGRQDVITRASNGSIAAWLGEANGQFTRVTPTLQIADLNWRIVAVGDFNGDGSDDLVWRHSSGAAAEWLGTASGDFTYFGALPTVDPSWVIQSPDIL